MLAKKFNITSLGAFVLLDGEKIAGEAQGNDLDALEKTIKEWAG